MTINEALELLNGLLSETDKKSEKRIYHSFIHTLAALKKKDLTEEQTHLIQEKLSSLDLKTTPENRKNHFEKKHSEFKAFLKNEFSYTPEKYYTGIGMIYGMIFGSGIGLSFGVVIDPAFGTSIGLSIGAGIGMILGMMYGVRKDTEAKNLGRTL